MKNNVAVMFTDRFVVFVPGDGTSDKFEIKCVNNMVTLPYRRYCIQIESVVVGNSVDDQYAVVTTVPRAVNSCISDTYLKTSYVDKNIRAYEPLAKMQLIFDNIVTFTISNDFMSPVLYCSVKEAR